MPVARILSLLLVVAMLSGLATTPALAAEEPEVAAEAAIIYCATTGEVVWEKNADEELNPASITKLMTCLLAAESLDLDKEITVGKEAAEVIPSKIYLQEGEVITVQELLYAAMLGSANDAAATLAIAVAGSIEEFADMMNQRAQALGCTHTRFENPHGLKGESHYSSARDIARICEAAFANKTIRKIAKAKSHTIPATNASPERKLKNGNLFIRGGEVHTDKGTVEVEKYEGVIGGKTGTTEENVATMAVALQYDDLDIYTVILGSTLYDRYTDEKTLLDYARENVSKYVAFEEGTEFEEGKLRYGATNRVTGVAAKPGYVRLPEGASPSLLTMTPVYEEDLRAPIKAGQKVGVVEIYLADEKLREVDLLAAEDVKEGWFLSRFGITNVQTIIIAVVAVVVLGGMLIILILRAVNRRRRARLRRRRILEAARRELEQENSWRERDWPH